MALYHELAFKKSSELLLQLALLIRTYDNQMKNSKKADEYKKFARENDSDDYDGVLEGKDKFHFREVCNKIIHAQEVRPLYEKADKFVIESDNSDLGKDIWCLTEEIELAGELRGNEWNAVVYTQPFIETVLGQIQFGYPIDESAASKANSAES